MRKTLAGQISITRPHYGNGKKAIQIELTDKTSGCELVHIEVPLEAFAEALTGLSHMPCTFDFFEGCPLGKRRELKEELLSRPKGYKQDKIEAAALLAPFEVDGWNGDAGDLYNHHNWRGRDRVAVTFIRYVENGASEATTAPVT